MAKEGSTISGLMDTIATMTSVSLQYGVPLRDLVNKFAHVRFEPAGFTGNNEIPIAKSIVDYVFRWMGSRFLPSDEREALGLIGAAPVGALLGARCRSPRSTTQPGPPVPPAEVGGAAALAQSSPVTDASAPDRCTDAAPAALRRSDRPCPVPVEWEWEEQRARDGRGNGIPGRDHQGLVQRQCGLTQLRRLRQHHGPQRQLLQVPQLRLHERLQLATGSAGRTRLHRPRVAVLGGGTRHLGRESCGQVFGASGRSHRETPGIATAAGRLSDDSEVLQAPRTWNSRRPRAPDVADGHALVALFQMRSVRAPLSARLVLLTRRAGWPCDIAPNRRRPHASSRATTSRWTGSCRTPRATKGSRAAAGSALAR